MKIIRCLDSAEQMLSAPTQTVAVSERSVVYFSLISNFDRVFSYFDNRKGNENSMQHHRQVVKFGGTIVCDIFGQIWWCMTFWFNFMVYDILVVHDIDTLCTSQIHEPRNITCILCGALFRFVSF